MVAGSFGPPLGTPRRLTHFPLRAECVRYAILGGRLPLLTEALSIGDAVRRGAMAMFGRLHAGRHSPLLSGRGPGGRILKGHRYAHYLSSDEDGDDCIDHLTIWCPAGLSEKELRALHRLSLLRRPGDCERLALAYIGHGSRAHWALHIFAPTRRWRSRTPVILPSGPKHGGRPVTPERQVAKELERRNYPAAAKVELIAPARGSWSDFQQGRAGAGRASGAQVFGFRLEFSTPVRGPIVLGEACHYGLGLFVPE